MASTIKLTEVFNKIGSAQYSAIVPGNEFSETNQENKGNTQFVVNAVMNTPNLLDLMAVDHSWLFQNLTDDEVNKFIDSLTTALTDLGAEDIKSESKRNTPFAIAVYISYNFFNINKSDCDPLCTVIAEVCTKALEDVVAKQ